MKVIPLFDRVLVRQDELSGESMQGGIIIPDRAREKPLTGTVIAAGPGEYQDGLLVPMPVKEGDRVLFGSKYAGNEMQVNGEMLLIMRANEIAGIIEEGESNG